MPGLSNIGFGAGFAEGLSSSLQAKRERDIQAKERQIQNTWKSIGFLVDSGQVKDVADLQPQFDSLTNLGAFGDVKKGAKGQPNPQDKIVNMMGQVLAHPLPGVGAQGGGQAPPSPLGQVGQQAPQQQGSPGPVLPNFGQRADGSQKGNGFFGPLARPDGQVSSELSMGTTDVTGQETEIPLLVPTLSKDEVQYLLSAPPGDWNNPVMKGIVPKAIAYAKQRQAQGKSFFAQPGEEQNLYPELQRGSLAPLPSAGIAAPPPAPKPRSLFGVPLQTPEAAAARQADLQVSKETAITTARIRRALSETLPALRAIDPKATPAEALEANGVRLTGGTPNFSIVSGTNPETGQPINMRLDHRSGQLTPVEGLAPKPSGAGVGGTKIGTFGDYLLRYATDHGLDAAKLTTSDVDAARKEYAASSISATAKAGTFGDYLDKYAADKGIAAHDLTGTQILSARRDFAQAQAAGTGAARNAAELDKPIGPTAGALYKVPPTTPLRDLANKPGLTAQDQTRISQLGDADAAVKDIEDLIKKVFPQVQPGVVGALHTKFALGMKRLAADSDLSDLDTAIGLAAINIGRLAGETGRVPVQIINQVKADLANIRPSLFNGSTQEAALAKLARVKKMLEDIRANAPGGPAAGAKGQAGGGATVPGAVMRDGHLFINGVQID